jgi:hypothetical protein
MTRSILFIRDVEDETKRKLKAFADAHQLTLAGALRVMVDTMTLAEIEALVVLVHTDKNESAGPLPER